mmetsp:Transcript_8905/g.12984  ORF Transcript_8905/g.12984 Transcript_8905/m.12984 type:complete len:134 (-) Transcript_8905:909-1310(-)
MSPSPDKRTRFAMAPMPTSFVLGLVVTVASYASRSDAYTSPMFQASTPMQKTAPSKTEGVEIELPNFDELFNRIQQVSPLARVAMEGGGNGEERGFAAAGESCETLTPKYLRREPSSFFCLVCRQVFVGVWPV